MNEFWLCTDCTIAAVNDDFSGLDYHYSREEADEREADIRAGLAKLNFESEHGYGYDEFSRRTCDCCDSSLAGTRSRFIMIHPQSEPSNLTRAAKRFAYLQAAYPTLAARGDSVTEGDSGTFRECCTYVQSYYGPWPHIFARCATVAERYHNRHAFGARVPRG